MPKFFTDDFKGKTLYYDLRENTAGPKEGVYARPIFESDYISISRKCEADGKKNLAWVEMLAFAIVDWCGFVTVEGKEIPCTPDNIRKLCESDPVQMRHLYVVIGSASHAQVEIAEKN
ncbi:MAG: hypothetical protein LBV80_07860 [Deltaproteobacteria bacterium]|jgi:hypothetical protein|nr:hypothetical protein [Deltaproteobacteria bacterium]